MARGGKRKGSGRKPTGKIAMLVRVDPWIRTTLTRQAKQSGLSLSAATERHLSDVLSSAPKADRPTRALCYLIQKLASAGRSLESDGDHDFDWRAHRFDFEAFKSGVIQLLDRLAPEGNIGQTPYHPRDGANANEVGAELFKRVWVILTMGDVLREYGDRAESPRGSMFYAFPQVADDLGIAQDGRK